MKVVAIGCGLAARGLHAPAIAALPDVELVGLCDRNEESMRAVAKLAGGDPTCSADAEKLLAELRPDVALILTPPATHESLTGLALEAGAHVLVEKPFAETAEAANRMAERAEACGRHLSVVHNELFTPSMDALRRRIAAGEIGEVSSVHYLTSSRNQRYVPDAWYFEALGGRMGETLPHALCILDELLGALQVRSVQASHLGKAILPDWAEPGVVGVDDLRVELGTPDGTRLGSLWYSLNSWVPTSVLVCGSEGNLVAQPFGEVSRLSNEPPPMAESLSSLRRRFRRGIGRRIDRLRKRRSRPPIEESSHYAQLAHFFEAIRSGRTPSPQADSACRVTALWQEIVARMNIGNPVT